MDHPPQPPYPPPPFIPEARPADRPCDPPAAALGNASLLGVGYLLLGRRVLAAVTDLVTLVLLVLLGTAFRTVWWEIVVLVWWVALVAHGWLLAGKKPAPTTGAPTDATPADPAARRRQRVVAVCCAVPVLLVVGLLRFDAAGTGHTVDRARVAGDCARAREAQRGVWFGPRVADSPLAAKGDAVVTACGRVDAAKSALTEGLKGDTSSLSAGFAGLSAVLAHYPGNGTAVGDAVDGFVRGLPQGDPCDTVTVTDWLRRRPVRHDALDRAADAVAGTAPGALDGCAGRYMTDKKWAQARTKYQQLVDQYPHHALAGGARSGIHQATLAIELDDVTHLLSGSTDSEPEYCSHPAKYEAAPAVRRGTNRTLFFGAHDYTSKLPASWRASGIAKAALVLCAGDKGHGPNVRTCPYANHANPDFPHWVTFHKVSVPVKVYALRTGRLVWNSRVRITGASCPSVLHYTYYDDPDLLPIAGEDPDPPPSDVYVKPTHGDVVSAFRSAVSH